jgi:F-type H+-transporting ATPase subunit delta
MKPIRLASRYAKALFELAGEMNIREQVFNDMTLLVSVCRQNKDFVKMLQSPLIRYDKKNEVLRAIFKDKVDKISITYMEIITKKRREMILEEIGEQYIILYREWKGIKTAYLSAVVEIDEKTKNGIIEMLQKQLKAKIELITTVDPKLIGGFLLTVEGKQFDTTILKKINRLTREFNINIYERKL